MTEGCVIKIVKYNLMASDKIFGGLAKIEMEKAEFDLGHRIVIRKTYAHLFAPFMMAYSPPRKDLKLKVHGDVKTTRGGIAFDILVEVEMPELKEFKDSLNQEDMLWLIACLIRLGSHPFIMLSAIADMSFNSVKGSEKYPTIYPYEFKNRIFVESGDTKPFLTSKDLLWLKENWIKAARLIKDSTKFHTALRAFDDATIQGKASSSLLNIWGAIEQLFSPNTGELKYRVSANLASFLKGRGEERLKLFKELSKLYNERSSAAHTSSDITYSPVVGSYVHLRNALIKIIETGKVASQEELEELVFK